jgi:hypothetical protein
MRVKRSLTSLVAAAFIATAAVSGSTAPASAASLTGIAGFTANGVVQCGSFWVSTYMKGIDHWVLHSTVLHNGTYWALDHVDLAAYIYDPYPIREECGPYQWSRLFSLKNSSGTLVASNQTATGSPATSGCASYLIDPNQYTLSNSCHIEPYYFKYTHPAGYIYYGGTVFLGDNYSISGNTGWRSLGG